MLSKNGQTPTSRDRGAPACHPTLLSATGLGRTPSASARTPFDTRVIPSFRVLKTPGAEPEPTLCIVQFGVRNDSENDFLLSTPYLRT